MIFRRRREFKTDYRRRKKILLSKLPFIYVFKSNRYVWAQIIVPAKNGDRTMVEANSKEIIKAGWHFSGKNFPAFYLVGLLLGKRAAQKGIKEAILYTGVRAYRKNSKVAALLKGAIDAGFKVRVDESTLPPDDLINGKSISAYAAKLRESGYSGVQFSKVLPFIDNITAEFNEMKNKILSGELK